MPSNILTPVLLEEMTSGNYLCRHQGFDGFASTGPHSSHWLISIFRYVIALSGKPRLAIQVVAQRLGTSVAQKVV